MPSLLCGPGCSSSWKWPLWWGQISGLCTRLGTENSYRFQIIICSNSIFHLWKISPYCAVSHALALLPGQWLMYSADTYKSALFQAWAVKIQWCNRNGPSLSRCMVEIPQYEENRKIKAYQNQSLSHATPVFLWIGNFSRLLHLDAKNLTEKKTSWTNLFFSSCVQLPLLSTALSLKLLGRTESSWGKFLHMHTI